MIPAWLRRSLSWLGVPKPAPEPEIDEHGPLPNGIYRFPAGMELTGYEPLSVYLKYREADADRPILLATED